MPKPGRKNMLLGMTLEISIMVSDLYTEQEPQTLDRIIKCRGTWHWKK